MPPNDQSTPAAPLPPALRFPDGRRPRIALVLQGGGALGAYQIGVFQALEEAGIVPDWVTGISIGAINAALIVGNKPEDRLHRLAEFWETISRPSALPVPGDMLLRRLYNVGSSTQAIMLGQPGFFEPHRINPWLAAPGTPQAISFYDTAPLRETLNRLVDFDYLNNNRLRLSLGAVNVETGDQVYFDSAYTTITVEHVMASGALPPSFPPVQVGADLCWDGGVLSNTPLFTVLDEQPRVDTLCFMVDLWDPVGPAPRTMIEVTDRQKDIAYASHIRRHIENFRALHDLRRSVNALATQLPPAASQDPNLQRLIAMGCTTTMNIVHLLYRSRKYDTGTKDYEFSRASIADHRAAGYRDGSVAVEQSAWLEPVPAHVGVTVHEVFSHPDIASMATPAAAAEAAGTPPKTPAARKALAARGKPATPR